MLLSLLIFSLFTPLASPQTPPPSPPPSIHDLLPKFGLPRGLLPDAVASYSVSSNGRFEVRLASECYVELEYLTYYAPNITGVIRYGGIEELKGVQVRKFLIWFDVEAIMVDLPPTDYIYFEVGWITKKLAVDQFQTLHDCKSKDILSQFLDPASESGLLITE